MKFAFLVDTGCARTTITESTALRIGIDILQLPERPPAVGIGGSVGRRELQEVRLIFEDIDQAEVIENLPFIDIFIPRNEEERMSLENTPNLLGLDIITRYTLRFYENEFLFLERD